MSLSSFLAGIIMETIVFGFESRPSPLNESSNRGAALSDAIRYASKLKDPKKERIAMLVNSRSNGDMIQSENCQFSESNCVKMNSTGSSKFLVSVSALSMKAALVLSISFSSENVESNNCLVVEASIDIFFGK